MKNKKPKFHSKENRDDIERKIQESIERLQGIQKNEWVTYNDAISQYLIGGQKNHILSQSFIFLCRMLKKFLEDKKNFDENRNQVLIAKENFESYCEFMESRNANS